MLLGKNEKRMLVLAHNVLLTRRCGGRLPQCGEAQGSPFATAAGKLCYMQCHALTAISFLSHGRRRIFTNRYFVE